MLRSLKRSWLIVFVTITALLVIRTSSVSVQLRAGAEGTEGGDGEANKQASDPSKKEKELEFTPCMTCVFIAERIKKGTTLLLPDLCNEVYLKFPDSAPICRQVLNALQIYGKDVRYWLMEGCYKFELYGGKEWVKPCPSHVMCTNLKQPNKMPFCLPLAMQDPFVSDTIKAGTENAVDALT